MNAAEPDWLDLRVPFDDAARQYALPLLDMAARALSLDAERQVGTERPLVVIDLGAGTGNSMRFFDRHLVQRLPERPLHWVLVDADESALEIAAGRFTTAVRTVAAPITSLPGIAAEVLDEVLTEVGKASMTEVGTAKPRDERRTAAAAGTPDSCDLLITGSALLDVLTRDDLTAIVDTLHRFSGIGIFLLSISGQWHLTPTRPEDGVLDEAFVAHQRRDSRLGTQAAPVLETKARSIGARVESSASPWHLEAPRDSEFLTRFLTERVDAAVEEGPRLRTAGRAWLTDRLAQAELRVVVDHIDVLIDATGHQRPRRSQLSTRSDEPKR
ncbi:trans-aconitate methyltransferase [Brevibacterium antiquum]|uniref:class I SAM-dependent methyltransferase n=1 Tax=Brevibacterium antiquum TaxID=234835 RepID=UPI0018DF4EBC|nr:class I SAM-dependent methyltransferase [Brevibacterium antiquum]